MQFSYATFISNIKAAFIALIHAVFALALLFKWVEWSSQEVGAVILVVELAIGFVYTMLAVWEQMHKAGNLPRVLSTKKKGG